MSVRLTDLTFEYANTFEENSGVYDINVEANPGSVTLLCGASGSGKSTLMKLINGLIPHFDEGERVGDVEVDGVDPGLVPLCDSGLHQASVFQNPRTQFFTTTVRDELAFAGQNYETPVEAIQRASLHALEHLGISELRDRDIEKLSGGQLQKVACAQAIAQGSPVILLDEPTANLDVGTIESVRAIIRDFKNAGKTVLIGEHRVYYLRDLVDNVIVLDKGRIVHQLSGAEFFSLSDERRREMGLRTLAPVTLPEATVAAARVATDEDAGETAESETTEKTTEAGSGVHIKKLIVNYGKRAILNLENLDFPAGQVTALIGENGVGKTTLARALCQLTRAGHGSRFSLNGKRMKKSDVFLVMQDVHRQLFTESVKSEADEEYLRELDLWDFADRHPMSLSGGQKQRLVIATALSSSADVIIFDEPTSGVDYRHLVSISTILRRLAEAGKTVIVISHDYELISECADRIVRLQAIESKGVEQQVHVSQLAVV